MSGSKTIKSTKSTLWELVKLVSQKNDIDIMNKVLDINDNCDVEDECVMAGCKEMDEEAKTTVDHKTLTNRQITRIIPVPSVI